VPHSSEQPHIAAEGPTPDLSRAGAQKSRTTIGRLFGGLGRIEYRLSKSEYVSGEDLAKAIESNPGEVLIDPVREYLCRFLRGQVKKNQGRTAPLTKD
jgi:hypothetical protein